MSKNIIKKKSGRVIFIYQSNFLFRRYTFSNDIQWLRFPMYSENRGIIQNSHWSQFSPLHHFQIISHKYIISSLIKENIPKEINLANRLNKLVIQTETLFYFLDETVLYFSSDEIIYHLFHHSNNYWNVFTVLSKQLKL